MRAHDRACVCACVCLCSEYGYVVRVGTGIQAQALTPNADFSTNETIIMLCNIETID